MFGGLSGINWSNLGNAFARSGAATPASTTPTTPTTTPATGGLAATTTTPIPYSGVGPTQPVTTGLDAATARPQTIVEPASVWGGIPNTRRAVDSCTRRLYGLRTHRAP